MPLRLSSTNHESPGFSRGERQNFQRDRWSIVSDLLTGGVTTGVLHSPTYSLQKVFQKGDDFGNDREARRLFQAAKEEMALRTISAAEVSYALSSADLKAAARRLLSQEKGQNQSAIGFCR